MNNSIAKIKDCYGCGVCAVICPKKIIELKLNKDGFYEPALINKEACINCGLCLSVCAFNDDKELDSKISSIGSYACWSVNTDLRKKCTSGGIGFEIGKYLIKKGYKACGVKYNAQHNRAEHFIAENNEEYFESVGSKYLQSYTIPGFSKLNSKDKFFVTGTPCQIDSIRRFIRKKKIEDNYVLMDFFCHGVPSMNMWNKYTNEVVRGIGKIRKIFWRQKLKGWHESFGISVEGDKNEYYSSKGNGDLFYRFFLGNICLGKACYDNCKYKHIHSAADIRIGDLWGDKYKDNEDGVSGMLVFTERGKDIINKLTDVKIVNETLDVVTEGQMKSKLTKDFRYYIAKWMLRKKISLLCTYVVYRLFSLHIILYRRFKR